MAIDTTRRGAGDTAAKGIISGEISNGITWQEDIEITEDGTAISGSPASWTWTLTLREDFETPAVLSLATGGSGLTVTQGTDSTLLSIGVAQSSLTNLVGEYIIDIRSLDTSSTTVDSAGLSKHWGHGTVLVRNEPPT